MLVLLLFRLLIWQVAWSSRLVASVIEQGHLSALDSRLRNGWNIFEQAIGVLSRVLSHNAARRFLCWKQSVLGWLSIPCPSLQFWRQVQPCFIFWVALSVNFFKYQRVFEAYNWLRVAHSLWRLVRFFHKGLREDAKLFALYGGRVPFAYGTFRCQSGLVATAVVTPRPRLLSHLHGYFSLKFSLLLNW